MIARTFDAAGVGAPEEIVVNTTRTNYQGNVAVAMGPGGGFLAVWESQGQDGSGSGVYAQRFGPGGVRQEKELRVNHVFAGDQWAAKAAIDGLGNATAVWMSTGHDDSGLGVVARRLGGAAVTEYAYDSRDRLTALTDALGYTHGFGYDTASNVTSATDGRGDTTAATYDGMGRVLTTTRPDEDANPANNPVWTSHYTGGLLDSVSDPLSHARTFTYDDVGRLKTETDALNHTTTYGYDLAGNLTSITDALSRQTGYTYDGLDRPVARTDGNNHVWTTRYDPAGQVTARLDPLNRETTYAYTPRGQLDLLTNPDGTTVNPSWCLCGCPNGLTLTNTEKGQTTSYAYTLDALGRVAGITDGLSHTMAITYDAAGNRKSVTDGLGNTTTNKFDALDRLLSTTDALGHATNFGYDGAGNLISSTDALGHATAYAYDAQDRPKRTTDARTGQTSFAYDLAGRLTGVTDPASNLTQYGYDNADRRTSETDPRNEVTAYEYDHADQLTKVTDRNNRVREFTYDGVGAPKTEKWKDGGGAVIYTGTFNYNTADQLTSATDASSTFAYTYDGTTELLLSVSDAGTMPNQSVTLSYDDDALGFRYRVSDNLGARVDSAYDAAGRLTNLGLSQGGVAGPQVAFAYDNADRRTGITRREGLSGPTVSTTVGYDNADRLTAITHTSSAAGALSSFTYGYDDADRLTSYAGPEGSKTYGYDDTNQLTSVTGVNPESFTYDLAGNRTMTGYSTGTGNRLLSDGTNNYTYDDEGNTLTQTRISDGQVTGFIWDHRNRLTKAEIRSSGSTLLREERYTYDVFDRRIGVWIDADGAGAGTGVQSWTVYDGANAWADFDAAGNETVQYLNGPGMDERYARAVTGGSVAWYLTDNVNSVRQVVSTSGTVLDQLTYSAFGTILSETAPANGDRFKYTGREWDAGTGQYYYRARYYGAGVGRFRSEDPIGFASGDSNPFRYVGNEPLLGSDPSGLIRTGPGVIPGGVYFPPGTWPTFPMEPWPGTPNARQEYLRRIGASLREATERVAAIQAELDRLYALVDAAQAKEEKDKRIHETISMDYIDSVNRYYQQRKERDILQHRIRKLEKEINDIVAGCIADPGALMSKQSELDVLTDNLRRVDRHLELLGENLKNFESTYSLPRMLGEKIRQLEGQLSFWKDQEHQLRKLYLEVALDIHWKPSWMTPRDDRTGPVVRPRWWPY